MKNVLRSAASGLVVALIGLILVPQSDAAMVTASFPIQHIVVIDQENHSFDNVLGAWCVAHLRCAGATTGRTSTGTVIALSAAADLVPVIDHSTSGQAKAVHGGKMNGFNLITGCASPGYACYTQFGESDIPNIIALASSFAVSDQTFSSAMPSFGSHLDIAAATSDGFVGDNPVTGTGPTGVKESWGCDSNKDALWTDPVSKQSSMQPSCVPDSSQGGPYRSSSVTHVDTIWDRLDAAGLTWRSYSGDGHDHSSGQASGYIWNSCTYFYECFNGAQWGNVVPAAQIVTDAAVGSLPNYSVVTPTAANSQHNKDSMLAGDNWIGQVVSAIESGPQWASTAVFITWDDCGCFYDHVPPPAGLGIRVPMIIVSPYVIAGHTDSTAASFASILAFVEHDFGLSPLSTADATAYDYTGSFSWSGPRAGTVELGSHPVPPWELELLATWQPDPDDPT